jgi:hypothetical protein
VGTEEDDPLEIEGTIEPGTPITEGVGLTPPDAGGEVDTEGARADDSYQVRKRKMSDEKCNRC